MRIITGKWKGIKLFAPTGRETRPTSDRVREGIFSIIGDEVAHTAFLDVFAGSGSVGLEALSRGARYVVFVEKNLEAIKYLQENIHKLNGEKTCRVIHADGYKVARLFRKENTIFDIIYLDPPFFLTSFFHKIQDFFNNPVMTKNGCIILEHFHKIETPLNLGNTIKIREIRYGDTGLSIYRLNLNN